MAFTLSLIIGFLGFFVCLSAHEAAHAYISDKLGDPTAKYDGRLTLNPLAHIDIFGTILLPLLLLSTSNGRFAFGYAKPVMVNIRNFRHPARDNFLTALAGPVANLIFAILLAVLLRVVPSQNLIAGAIKLLVEINIILAVFNLLPIPPLDGSKVWHLILSEESYFILERMGPFILIAVLIFSNSFGGGIFQLISIISNYIIGLLG